MPSEIITDQDQLNKLLREKFIMEVRSGYISAKGFCLPENYLKFADEIENMEVRDKDIWVCSFPRTGTMWTQEMVWCIANNLDSNKAKVDLHERFPFLDHSLLIDFDVPMKRTPGLQVPESFLNSVKYISELPSPRYIKTHLPFDLLPRQLRTGEKKPKIVYVARNPKDTCTSYYYHCKAVEGFRGDFNEFCSLFLAGQVTFAPFWNHVLGFWNKKDIENFLFLKYEDMKADLASAIKKTADFLGKTLNFQDNEILKKYLNYDNMKPKETSYSEKLMKDYKRLIPASSELNFITINQRNEEMSDKTIELFDNWTVENLKNTGLIL